MHRLLLILATLSLSFTASAQSKFLSTAADAKRTAEGIVARIAASNFPGAWQEMKPLSVVPTSEIEVFEAQFNSQAETMLRRFGSPIGHELIREESLGTSLVRYQFLVRHEKAPLRWMFVFYRTEKGWVMTDFKFDGNSFSFFPGGV
jgi:hypothetical protein